MSKALFIFKRFCFCFVFFCALSSCQKNEINLTQSSNYILFIPPSVSLDTTSLSAFSDSINIKGKIDSSYQIAISNYGFCLSSKNSNPSISDTMSNLGAISTFVSNYPFSSKFGRLTINRKYYVRSYAQNTYGITYSKPFSFVFNHAGDVMFWTKQSTGRKKVYIDNIFIAETTMYYSSGTPDCNAAGCVTKNLMGGSHTYYFTSGSYTSPKVPFTVIPDQCTKIILTQ